MSNIVFENVTLRYPVYSARSQSLRNNVLRFGTGGIICKEAGRLEYVTALENVSFNIKSGDIVGLIGHNGSGKSTLLRTMAGIYKPTTGHISTSGKVSTIFDIGAGLDSELSGYENIVRLSLYLGLSMKQARNNIADIEEFSGLGDFLELPVKSYSTGMMLRLMFSVATSVQPEILLIDEVFGTGDESFQYKASKRMESLMLNSKIIVMATHVHEIIKQYCNRFFMLNAGTLEEIAINDF